MDLSVKTVEHAPPPEVRGPTAKARLVVGPSDFAGQSPFLLMAEDWYSRPAGFPTHPHRGMETVSFVLDGQVVHEDHTGGHGVLDKGDVQFMTAGAGVLHSENPGPAGVHSLQLWLNLPARLKRVPARYANMRRADAPVHRSPGVDISIYAGRVEEVHAPFGSTWPLTLLDMRLEELTAYALPLPAGERVFVYMLEGETEIGTPGQTVSAGDVVWMDLSPDSAGNAVLRFQSNFSKVRALIFASPPIDEPVIARGPFVMNTELEIDEAYADYRAGRFTQGAEVLA